MIRHKWKTARPAVLRREGVGVVVVEPLDPRRMLSATYVQNSSRQEFALALRGSGRADEIRVERRSGVPGGVHGPVHLAVYGVPGVPDGKVFRNVQRVTIDGRGGHDRIETDASIMSTVAGGLGDDTVVGTGRVDEILGGGGDDVLFASSHTDRVEGGEGDDVLKLRRGQELSLHARVIFRPGNGDDIVDTRGSEWVRILTDTTAADTDGDDRFLIDGRRAREPQVKRSPEAPDRLIVAAKKVTDVKLLKLLGVRPIRG